MSLAQWNRRQMIVLSRVLRRFGVDATPDVVAPLAARYARKHAALRLTIR